MLDTSLYRCQATQFGGAVVPLSDEEQRVLDEIERQLYETDPQLAHTVRTRGQVDAPRRARWAGLAVVAGLSILVAGFRTSVIIGLLGFAVMFAGLVIAQQALRDLAGERGSVWAQRVRERAAERNALRRRRPPQG